MATVTITGTIKNAIRDVPITNNTVNLALVEVFENGDIGYLTEEAEYKVDGDGEINGSGIDIIVPDSGEATYSVNLPSAIIDGQETIEVLAIDASPSTQKIEDLVYGGTAPDGGTITISGELRNPLNNLPYANAFVTITMRELFTTQDGIYPPTTTLVKVSQGLFNGSDGLIVYVPEGEPSQWTFLFPDGTSVSAQLDDSMTTIEIADILDGDYVEWVEPVAIAPVTNLQLAITGTNKETITATWDIVTGATIYEIEYSDDGVSYTPVDTTALLTFDIEDTDYDPDVVTHYVRVRAVGGDDWTVETISGLMVNLVAFWEMDEASGNRVDRVAGLILTDSGTVGSATGLITALAADLDGSNRLSISDNATISMGAGVRCTFMGWVYPESADGNFFTKRSDTVLEYINRFQGGNFQFIASPDGSGSGLGFVATPEPALNAWAMYCARYTGTAITANINNGTEATTAYSTDIFNGATSLYVGDIPAVGEGYDGRVNPVGIWKRALSASQQTDFYNGGTGKNYPFL